MKDFIIHSDVGEFQSDKTIEKKESGTVLESLKNIFIETTIKPHII